jgi:hypothetical protein
MLEEKNHHIQKYTPNPVGQYFIFSNPIDRTLFFSLAAVSIFLSPNYMVHGISTKFQTYSHERNFNFIFAKYCSYTSERVARDMREQLVAKISHENLGCKITQLADVDAVKMFVSMGMFGIFVSAYCEYFIDLLIGNSLAVLHLALIGGSFCFSMVLFQG